MIEDFLKTECQQAAEAAIDQARAERETKIKAFQERSELRRIGRIFGQWQKFTKKQRIQAKILNNFPANPSGLEVN